MLTLSMGTEVSRPMVRVEVSSGLPRGFVSCWFSIRELAEAVRGGGGEVGGWSATSLAGARGAAAAAAGAGLAGDVAARGAELAAGARGLRLRLLADLPPRQRPPLWFDDATLAALHMPFLTLANIRGGTSYECHLCGAEFERPNPLKLHLFLSCAPFDPAAFWSLALRRLAGAAGAAAEAGEAGEAGEAAEAGEEAGRVLGDDACARLEAAAAEWGRARGGHACVYCGKLYSRKYGLKIHIRTHTGYKPLRCRYCLRAFGDPSNLNKHVRLHAAASPAASSPAAASPPHACPVCGKQLVRRRDLERHVRSRHALCAP